MGRPLRAVAVIDSPATASGIAADLKQCGHEVSLTFAAVEGDLRRLPRGSCEIVLACHPNPSLDPERVLGVLQEGGVRPRVMAWGESFTDDEIVTLVTAGLHDCLRRGDAKRLGAAIERDPRPDPPAPPPDAPARSAAAEAVVKGEAGSNVCVAGGFENAVAVAKVMGVEVKEVEPEISLPGCRYDLEKADIKFKYNGFHDCRAAMLLYGGTKECPIGCLGLGTCAEACSFGAITMHNNLPIVSVLSGP